MREIIKKLIEIFKLRSSGETEERDKSELHSFPVQDEMFKLLRETSLKPLSQGVAIYARVANNENNGLAKQIAELENTAESVGDMDVAIYSEISSGISKDETERSELYRLMRDSELGLIKRIYIKSIDRIARDFVFGIEVSKKLYNCGVELIEVQ